MKRLSKRRKAQFIDDFMWETGFRHTIYTIFGIVGIVSLIYIF